MKKIYFSFLMLVFAMEIFSSKNVLSQSTIDPVLAAKLQTALDNQFSKYNLKGVVAAISMPNDEIWYGASGTSNDSDTISSTMLFGIGSNTKTFTAALTMLLIEDSLIRLDDSIYHWVATNPFIDSTITIRQLLNHTSGLYNYTDHPAIDDSLMFHLDRFWKPEEILTTFMDDSYFAKGQDYHYANTNYLILGMIVKAVSGTTFSDVLHTRILNPLGLTHTFMDQEDSLVGELAHVWYDIFSNGDMYDLVYYNLDRTSMYSSMWTAGAMFSTAEDMVRWSKGLFSGKVVNDSTLQQMLDFLPGDDYGLGIVQYSISGRELWGHGGDVIYKSFLLYSPLDTISIVLLCNDDRMTYSQRVAITESILNAYLGISKLDEEKIDEFIFSVYPNPATTEIALEYVLDKSSVVSVDVFTLMGQHATRICSEKQVEGKQKIKLNCTQNNLNVGMYTFKVEVEGTIKYIPFVITN